MHSYRLGEKLSELTPTLVLTSASAMADAPFQVRPTIGNWNDAEWIRAELSDLPSDAAIVWQYSPTLFGAGGVNRALPRLWREFRNEGRRQVVIAHEIRPARSWQPMRRWRWWLQTRQFDAALESANAVALSTEMWVLGWRQMRPRQASKISLIPLPSGLDVAPVEPGHAARWRQRNGLPANARVMAWFGSQRFEKRFDLAVDAWRAAHTALGNVALVFIGSAPGWSPFGTARQWYRPLGYQSASDASASLQAADLLVFPFADGVSERRTTFMGGLAHGVPVLASVGFNTGPTLANAPFFSSVNINDETGWVRRTTELLRDDAGRPALGAAGRAAYERHYSWPATLESLERLLAPAPEPQMKKAKR